MTNLIDVTITVNGTQYQRAVEPRRLLSDFLRHDLELTGTHVGCEHGVCGVEGLGTPDNLHPLQEAFWEAHGLQCGYCTPGILMTIIPFLKDNPHPTEEEIRSVLTGNLCRCTGYQHIVDAVRLASEKLSP
jgi:aerobic-type carbon monoxide dehydrogenase small subunit (CoxS/CutS family)